MKKNFIVAAGLLFGTLMLASCGGNSAPAGSGNAALDNIMNRKSVREYTARPVDEAQIDQMLRAGMAAPSARDLRPWELIVIRERTALDSLAAALPYAKMLSGAPLAIVVCGDTVASPKLWMLDCSAVTENILLAAESLGLGAVWTAAWPYPDRIAAVRRITALPEHVQPLCVIPIGYPQGPQAPKNKYNTGKVHREKF